MLNERNDCVSAIRRVNTEGRRSQCIHILGQDDVVVGHPRCDDFVLTGGGANGIRGLGE